MRNFNKNFKWRFDDCIKRDPEKKFDRASSEGAESENEELVCDVNTHYIFGNTDKTSYYSPSVYEPRTSSDDESDLDNGSHKNYFKTPSSATRELEVIKESSQSSSENDIVFAR